MIKKWDPETPIQKFFKQIEACDKIDKAIGINA